MSSAYTAQVTMGFADQVAQIRDVLPMLRAWMADSDTVFDENMVASEMVSSMQHGRMCLVVARDGDGEPVGTVTMVFENSALRGGEMWMYVDRIFVVPGRRGSMALRTLHDAVRLVFRLSKPAEVLVNPEAHRKNDMRFYERMGFTPKLVVYSARSEVFERI